MEVLLQRDSAVVWDLEWGNLLSLGKNKRVLLAFRGYEELSEQKVKEMYGD